MFSWEIDELLRLKGNVITRNDYFKLNPIESQQIAHIHYDAGSRRYQVYTNDGYSWDFEVVNE